MLTFTSGNMFDDKVDIPVIPVNCIGVMGAGLALEFKQRFPPQLFEEYQMLCIHKELIVGYPRLIKKIVEGKTYKVIFFPTKDHWKLESKIGYITIGLKNLAMILMDNKKIKPEDAIGVPRLGCGLGGLDWSEVKPLILKHLSNLNNNVVIYE